MTGASPPICRAPESIVRALDVPDGAARDRAREQVLERPIAYPVGSAGADEVALAARLKPLLRQVLGRDALERERRRFEARGYAVGTTDREVDYLARLSGRPEARAIVVGRDPERVREMLESERTLSRLVAEAESEAELEQLATITATQGRLLGYPRCCVEAFVAATRLQRTGHLDGVHAALERTRGSLAARLNMLDYGVFHYLPWTPCAFDCEPSRAYADAVATLFAGRFPEFVQRVDRALGAHRLVVHKDVQLSLVGRWNGAELYLEHAWPTARDRHPESPLPTKAIEAVARLLALVRRADVLRLDGELLMVDEHPLLRAPGLRMFPFGECGG